MRSPRGQARLRGTKTGSWENRTSARRRLRLAPVGSRASATASTPARSSRSWMYVSSVKAAEARRRRRCTARTSCVSEATIEAAPLVRKPGRAPSRKLPSSSRPPGGAVKKEVRSISTAITSSVRESSGMNRDSDALILNQPTVVDAQLYAAGSTEVRRRRARSRAATSSASTRGWPVVAITRSCSIARVMPTYTVRRSSSRS